MVLKSRDVFSEVEWNKKNEEDFRNLKVKLSFEFEDVEHSKRMTNILSP